MADDGHTINVGPVTVGEPLPVADLDKIVTGGEEGGGASLVDPAAPCTDPSGGTSLDPVADRIIKWCTTHDDVAVVYGDKSVSCRWELVVETHTNDHVLTDLPEISRLRAELAEQRTLMSEIAVEREQALAEAHRLRGEWEDAIANNEGVWEEGFHKGREYQREAERRG